jgi:acyl carrier protein
MSDLEPRLLALVEDFDYYALGAPRSEHFTVSLDTTFVELGYDSLDLLELTMELEDMLGIELTDDELKDVVKIGGLLEIEKIRVALENMSRDPD